MFPIIQGNPYVQGFAQGQEIKSRGMQNKEQEQRLKTLPELLAAQLELEQQKAAQAGIQTEYMPQDLQSQIGLRGAQTQHTLAGIPLLGAQTAHTNAQTSLTNAQRSQLLEAMKYMPLDKAIEVQRAMTQQGMLMNSMQRFGPMYQTREHLSTLDPATRAAWIAENPELVEQMAQDQLTQQQLQRQMMQGVITPDLLKNAGFNVPQSTPPQNADQSQMPIQQGNAPLLEPAYKINPKTADTIKRTSQNMANKYGGGEALWDRYQNVKIIEGFMGTPDVRDAFSQMSKWSGIIGKGKATKDKFLDENEYLQYKSFTETQLPMIITGGLKYIEKMPTTDKSVDETKQYFNLAQGQLGKDPEAAMNYVYQGMKFIDAEGRAVTKQAEKFFPQEETQPLEKGQRQYNEIKANSGGKLSPDQIDAIMKNPKYSQYFQEGGAISPDQNNTKLVTPTFNSKQDFQNWYQGLSAEQKQQYKAQAGGR